MRYFSLTVFLFSIGFLASAQVRSYTVLGVGEVTETANRAELSFIIKRDGRTIKSAFADAQRYLNTVFSDMRSIGIDSTSWHQSKVRVNEKNLAWFTLDKAEAVLRTKVVLDSIHLIEDFLEILSKYDVEFLSDIDFSLKNDTELKQRAYVAALEDARSNAMALAKAVGATLGNVLHVEEYYGTSAPLLTEYRRESYAKMSALTTVSTIIPEHITRERRLLVTFAVE